MSENSKPIFLSVVMPAYNEEKNISEAIRRVRAFMSHQKYEWELLIVDDGSGDNTADVARNALAKDPEPRVQLFSSDLNKGKGASVKKGVLASHGERVLVTDADLSSPMKEVQVLLNALDRGFDVAIGSRAIREAGRDVQQSFKRTLSGRIFNLFVRGLVLSGLKDTQCGFKCFKKEVARKLFSEMTLDGFAFDVEILCLARKNGYKIKEVPVMWRQGKDSRVKLFRDSFAMVGDLFRLRKKYGAC